MSLFFLKMSQRKSSAGDGLIVSRGAWQFDNAVPGVFDTHISKSIPGYLEGHDLIVEQVRCRMQNSGRCYDLGCSTGTLTAKMAACSDPERMIIVGIDQVDGMIARATTRCREFANVSFESGDLVHYDLLPSSVIVSYYTLHFTPVAARMDIVRRICRALQPDGLFLLFEKIRFADPEQDREMTERYHRFKKSRGFSSAEIRSKAQALEGVLEPCTESENLSMLRQAGFGEVSIIFNELCWQGYLASVQPVSG